MSSVLASNSWADKLPTKVTRLVHALAIASLISQIGIIVTGGAVRLTESGLGCSQWPNCVPGSMTLSRKWASTESSSSATAC